MKRLMMAGLGIALVTNLTFGSASAKRLAVYQPDGQISKDSLPPVGDDVYNTSGVGETVSQKVKPGKGATYYLRLQNDGSGTDTFTGFGCASSGKFSVKYLAGAIDITPSMTAGTFALGPIASGGTQLGFDVKIKAKSSASSGAHRTCLITFTSDSDSAANDTVGAKIVVK